MKIKKLFTIFFILFFGIGLFVPATNAANLGDAFTTNYSDAADQMGYKTDADITPEYLVSRLIFYLLYFLGVIFLILIIYGGYLWMTARGNEKQAEKAREVLTAAAIGLIIVIAAYAITWMIINTFSAYLQ